MFQQGNWRIYCPREQTMALKDLGWRLPCGCCNCSGNRNKMTEIGKEGPMMAPLIGSAEREAVIDPSLESKLLKSLAL